MLIVLLNVQHLPITSEVLRLQQNNQASMAGRYTHVIQQGYEAEIMQNNMCDAIYTCVL